MTHYWTGCEIFAFLVSLGIIVVSFFCILFLVRLPFVVHRKEPWRSTLKYKATDVLPIIVLAAALWVEEVTSPRVEAYVCHVCGQPNCLPH